MLLSFMNQTIHGVISIFPSTFNDLTEAQRPGPGRDPVSGRRTGPENHFLAGHAHP
jgi:hypothetical protein